MARISCVLPGVLATKANQNSSDGDGGFEKSHDSDE